MHDVCVCAMVQGTYSCIPVRTDGECLVEVWPSHGQPRRRRLTAMPADKGDMQVWGQCSYSLAPGGGKEQVEVSGRYVRCWQGKGRSDWNVVVEVTPSQREAFFRAAAFLRQQVGVVVGPCLTALGCALRKERQTVFNSLLQQGLKPRWRKGVEIEFFSAGGWIQHDFEYFGG